MKWRMHGNSVHVRELQRRNIVARRDAGNRIAVVNDDGVIGGLRPFCVARKIGAVFAFGALLGFATGQQNWRGHAQRDQRDTSNDFPVHHCCADHSASPRSSARTSRESATAASPLFHYGSSWLKTVSYTHL